MKKINEFCNKVKHPPFYFAVVGFLFLYFAKSGKIQLTDLKALHVFTNETFISSKKELLWIMLDNAHIPSEQGFNTSDPQLQNTQDLFCPRNPVLWKLPCFQTLLCSNKWNHVFLKIVIKQFSSLSLEYCKLKQNTVNLASGGIIRYLQIYF